MPIARAQIPNLLTFGRVAAVPVALALVLLAPGLQGPLFLLFLAASVTDFLDGYLARKWQVTSALGALLDPIADKLLVAVMLLYLMGQYGLSLLPVSVMLLRELYISGLREFLAAKQVALPVSKGGKLKTSLQMTGILLMLLGGWWNLATALNWGDMILWAAAALSAATAWDYTQKSWPHLR